MSGSTRSGSTNTAALRTLGTLAAPVTAVLYEGMADLPALSPVTDPRFIAAATEVRRAIVDYLSGG